MIGTIVFGPRPEMVAGTLVVDTFDYLNWITRYFTGRLPINLLKSDPKKFDQTIDSGIIWELHQFFNYSILSFFGLSVLTAYFYFANNTVGFVFTASCVIHIFLDYLSHANYYLLFPLKLIKVKAALIDYRIGNFKKTLIIDVILFIVIIVRLVYNYPK